MSKIKLPQPKICKDCKIILTDLTKTNLCNKCYRKAYAKTDKFKEIVKK